MIPMNAMFQTYFFFVFSRSRQRIQNILRFIQEYAQLDQHVLNDTHECYNPSVFLLLLYFSRSRQIIQNILRLIQEYAQLDQNILNDTHECYVLSVFCCCCIFKILANNTKHFTFNPRIRSVRPNCLK